MRATFSSREQGEQLSSSVSVLFVSTHFRNGEELSGFAEHLARLDRGAMRIAMAVADNSGDLSHRLHPAAGVYRPGRNLGYLSGCAFALEQWVRDHGVLPEWVAVTNTDIELAEDFLTRLETLALPADAGVVAPDIVLPGGARQNPLLRDRPSPQAMRTYARLMRRLVFSAVFEISVRLRHVFRSYAPDDDASHAVIPIYAPHGSLMLFRRSFFERGGILAYGTMMYGEEIHIAEQARRAGVGVVWCPELVARHFEHSTTSKVSVFMRTEWRAESAEHLWQVYFRGEAA